MLNAKLGCQKRFMSFNLASFYGLLSTTLQPRFHRKENMPPLKLIYHQTVLCWEQYFFEYCGIDLLARLSRAFMISQNYVSIL